MPNDTTLTSQPRPSIPGHELLDLVGRGGMGVVYRARELGLNREVAVKFLQDRYAAAADSSNTEAPTDLFISYWKIGKLRQGTHPHRQAIEWFQKGLDSLRPLHAEGKLHGQFKHGVRNVEGDKTACERLAKLSPGLIDDSSWAVQWGWPRH